MRIERPRQHQRTRTCNAHVAEAKKLDELMPSGFRQLDDRLIATDVKLRTDLIDVLPSRASFSRSGCVLGTSCLSNKIAYLRMPACWEVTDLAIGQALRDVAGGLRLAARWRL